MNPLYLSLVGVLTFIAAGFQDNESVRDAVLRIVKERYKYATDEHHESVTERILQSAQADSADPQRLRTVLGNLNQIIRYAQSFVGPYDLRSAGSESAPALPESMKQLQHDLELQFVEQYVSDAMSGRTVTSKEREAIGGQIEYLLQEARNLMTPRFVGPYASEVITQRLGEVRNHLLGTFDFPSSSGFPRLLTQAEISDLLNDIRKTAEEVKPLEINQAPDAHRAPNASLEVISTYGRYTTEVDRVATRLWGVFDLWGPKRAEIKGRLEKLSKEVQAWRRAADAEWQRIEREARDKRTDSNKGAVNPPISRDLSTPTPTNTPKPTMTHSEPQTRMDRASFWAYTIVFLAALVCVVIVAIYVRRLVK